MPERYWMNDPNGPAFYNGVYHLFYQHDPVSIAWTNMHWGHSVSKDLVFWKHLPVALSPGPEPYDAGGIWSGSISFDPLTGAPIALYTGVNPQVQCMAHPTNISDPFLTNWTKSASNPFLGAPPAGFPQGNFRDPTTSWKSADGSHYILVGSGNGNGGAALLYRSRSGKLIDAQYAGHPLAQAVDISVDGMMWECPDFYPLNGSVWVLKASSWALGHGDHYYTGSYDQSNQTFSANVHGIYDYGSKFYASKSFLDSNPVRPSPRRVLWAWINEADDRFAQRGWAGVQGLPRQIALDPTDRTLLVNPIPELAALRSPVDHLHMDGLLIEAGGSFSLGGLEAVQAEILITFEYVGASANGERYPAGSTFGVRVLQSSDKREQTEIVLQGQMPVTKGLDLPGGDYRSLRVQTNDYLQCEDACDRDPLCHAWTLILGTPGRNNCWLKSSIPASNPNPQCVSGAKGLLRSNRTLSSLYPKADNYAELGPLFPGPPTTKRAVQIRVFVDHSIVEAFVNEGKERLTSRVYPTLPDSAHVELFAEGPYAINITSLDVWQLRSIW